MRSLRSAVHRVVALSVATSLCWCVVGAAPAADTYWNSGAASFNAWNVAGNWSSGVPDSTTNAFTTSSGAAITLGAAAQAKTFFVEGPVGGESTLAGGTLALSDQLWINVATGTADATILRLEDTGSAPVSVTASNATLAADAGAPGGVILDSRSGGSVSLAVVNTLTIGYDGSGSYVYSYPFVGTAGGSVAITASTIQASVLATSGTADYNYIGTYNTGHSVTATNLNLGIAGKQGGADNYGGVWNITNTTLGDQATATENYIAISDSGTFTNAGAFAVGGQGSNNTVYVGYTGYGTNDGTLRLTGANDLVIGSGSLASGNSVVVDFASTLSANQNIVVGLDGRENVFTVDNGSTVTSGGARLGVNAVSGSNSVTVRNGSSWTMNGTVRVGDKGTNNTFAIESGATVTLTGSGKNFFVGYDKSASTNGLSVSGSGSTLSVKAADADLVVAANVTGTGANSSLNVLSVSDGGLIDANRTLIGDGGQIWGDLGTVAGDVLVGTGGQISPGFESAGTLLFSGNVDLSNGGTFNAAFGGTPQVGDFIDVAGTLTLSGTSSLALSDFDFNPGLDYVIAHYGTLSGVFASVTGLPEGRTIDYNYQGNNQIAVTAVPEPATWGMAIAGLACGGFAMRQRRKRARQSLQQARRNDQEGPEVAPLIS